jgi:hypothetical protein
MATRAAHWGGTITVVVAAGARAGAWRWKSSTNHMASRPSPKATPKTMVPSIR